MGRYVLHGRMSVPGSPSFHAGLSAKFLHMER